MGKGMLFVMHFTLIFLEMLRCRIFHQHIIHVEGLVVMTQNPLAFLNFTAGNCVLSYQNHPFPFFWRSVLLFLSAYVFSLTLHWYKYTDISAKNFCRVRYAPAIQTEHSLTNTHPWPRHFQAHYAQELSLTTRTVANSGYCLYFPIFNFDNLPISCPSKQNICKNNLC